MLYLKSYNDIYDGELILDNLVQKIVEQSTMVRLSNNDLRYLYQASVVFSKVFYSNTSQGLSRVESVYQGIINAKIDNLGQYNRVILLFLHSRRSPLMMNELGAVSDIMNCFSIDTEIKWGLGIDDSLGVRLALYVICSK